MKKSILILAVLSAFAFTSCKEKASDKVNEENVAAAADRDATAAKFPVMSFEKTEFDFGTIQKGEKVEHLFKFTNTGDAPLVIVNATSSCGCTVPEYSKEAVAPGEEGQLLVKYDGSGTNQVNKTITIVANTEKGKETLKIKAFVQPKDGTGNSNMLKTS
ncbi:DUF1573 domain-containing protein [Marixanthomonas sp. SCSIO 43207]|uniref:DUF1573 domain-containing protein n=1 Tax=Marixanthomonas sp. SCSIO 43207 TaxID=2779360 RepID=UPI001CAA0D8E|nr:DUF1573 domain-containing protein [Marixanthomonas sp. SCSIO 43207]UAB81017.1 DUF1573 domain-containing protein [Marixanthomonas sp. SCSIO 43207]